MTTVKELEKKIETLEKNYKDRCATIEKSLNRLGKILMEHSVLSFSPFGFKEE
jgi:hypothetical protein